MKTNLKPTYLIKHIYTPIIHPLLGFIGWQKPCHPVPSAGNIITDSRGKNYLVTTKGNIVKYEHELAV